MSDPTEQQKLHEAALQKMIAATQEWSEASAKAIARTITREELAEADAKFKKAKTEFNKATRKPRKPR